MEVKQQIDGEQTMLWNGTAGRAWVDTQDLLEQMFKPFERLLVDAVASGAGRRILDVGCGTGNSTLAVARLLGAKGHCVGIDISDPMITAARANAKREGTPAIFVRANAQNHPFEPKSFDVIISRFGVMFFDDPVEVFSNLRRAASDSAQCRFIAWRSAVENPFTTTAERAAAPLVSNIPVRRPGAPGQFAFADRNHIHSILEESGWTDIAIDPIDVVCTLPERGLVPYLTRLGPLGLILQDLDDPTRANVIETVRGAFEPYVYGTDVRFTAACWMVGARASAAPKQTVSA